MTPPARRKCDRADRGNPGFATVEHILAAFNLRFRIQPAKATAR